MGFQCQARTQANTSKLNNGTPTKGKAAFCLNHTVGSIHFLVSQQFPQLGFNPGYETKIDSSF